MKKYYTLLISLIIYTISNAQSPGGFGTTNMNLWVKADAGTSSTTNSASLSNWTDQSGSGNDGTQTGTLQPTYQTVSTNYNPGIDIVGNSAPKQHFLLPDATLPGGGSDYTVLYVANNVTNTGFVIAAGVNVNRRANRFRVDANGGTNNSWQDSGLDLLTPANPVIAGKRILYSNNFNGTGSGSRTSFLQALDAGSMTSTSINTSTSNNKIGLREDGGGALIGDINEILVYTYSLSALNQAKAETYLAVKYGVTLDNVGGGTQGDYTATTGANIWDASDGSSYQNNVIGIGREDSEDLYQKQSHTYDDTTRIYLNTLETSNTTNTGTFNDFSYIMMGDNQGLMNANATANAEMPTGLTGCSLYSRLEREWKVTKTNVTEDFSWDVTLNAAAVPGSVNIAHLRLLVDDDGDFSNGGATCYYNGDGSGVVITYNNPVITISGISTTHISNNSTRYITVASINALTPLPVEIINFDAKCQNETPKLSWTTASEINNDYFTIERSSDAINFEAIATVNGNGNISTQLNYSWTDNNALNGTVYYRLKQTDFNGAFEYHGIRTVTCEKATEISIYPNPFESSFTVQLSENTSYPITVEVIDYLGRKVHSEIIENNATEIELNELPTGTYFVKVVNETTQTVERMVKMK